MLFERRASSETAKTVQEAEGVLSVRTGGLKTSGRMSRALDQNGSVLGNSDRNVCGSRHPPHQHRLPLAFVIASWAAIGQRSCKVVASNFYPQIYPQRTVPTVLFSDWQPPLRT